METTAYTHRVELDIPYERAVELATDRLAEQGFGILSEIDVKAKLKEKIGADFRKYVILGACNPELAHRALESETELGVLLPCNVVVYESGPGRSVVAAMAPKAALTVVAGENAILAEVAQDADQRLCKALAALEDMN